VAALAVCACYTQTRLTSLPVPGASLIVELNDVGRVEMASQIGPSVTRIEGYLDARIDSQFVLRVTNASSISGTVSPWSGESVTLRPTFVQAMFERRLHRGRTVAFAGGLASAVGFFVLTRGLGVLGGGSEGRTPGDPVPNPDSRWGH